MQVEHGWEESGVCPIKSIPSLAPVRPMNTSSFLLSLLFFPPCGFDFLEISCRVYCREHVPHETPGGCQLFPVSHWIRCPSTCGKEPLRKLWSMAESTDRWPLLVWKWASVLRVKISENIKCCRSDWRRPFDFDFQAWELPFRWMPVAQLRTYLFSYVERALCILAALKYARLRSSSSAWFLPEFLAYHLHPCTSHLKSRLRSTALRFAPRVLVFRSSLPMLSPLFRRLVSLALIKLTMALDDW